MRLVKFAFRLAGLLVALTVGLVAAYVLLILGVGLLLARSTTPYVYYVEPSPDRLLSRVTRIDYGGGVTVSATSDVYVVGRSFEEQAKVGVYDHGASSRFDCWRGDRAINVCMLRYRLSPEAASPKPRVTVRDVNGVAASVGVSWDCPPEVLEWNKGRGR